MKMTCFGALSVWEAGEALAFRSDKVRALLVYLALNANRPHRRESLAAMFWAEQPEKKARTNLRLTLSRLGKTLATVKTSGSRPLLESTRQTVQLNLSEGAHWIDVWAFKDYLAACEAYSPSEWWRHAGCMRQLEAAVALYTAPFLAGFTLGDAPEFDAWCLWQSESYHQQAMAAYQALTAHQLALRQYQQAQKYARQQLRLDPHHETAHRQLMQALAEAGQTDAALRQYDHCRHILAEAFAAAPQEETQSLAAGIRHGRFPSSQPIKGNVPAAINPFIGRRQLLKKLLPLLFDPKYRMITLTGTGGIGKTRLAQEAARQAGHLFADGVWLVELASLTDATLVANAVATTLGIRQESQQPLVEALSQRLQTKQQLLLLDNCEHLLDACAPLAQVLLHACPHLNILATSREPLRATGEIIVNVPPLSLPASQNTAAPNALHTYEAVALLVERVRATGREFHLQQDNIPAVVQLCRNLDGMPLAIELAAAQTGTLPVARIAARLDNRFRLLRSKSRTAPSRHRTLRGLIDWSYELLSVPERLLLQRLALFAGRFTAEAAAAICSDESLPPASVREHLTSLVEKSLVIMNSQRPFARYRLLETIRVYAREKLKQAGAETAVQVRYVDYYLQFAETAASKLGSAEQARWLEKLEVAHPNLLAALHICRQRETVPTGALRLAGALGYFWYVRGHFQTGTALYAQLLAQPQAQEQNAPRALALYRFGLLMEVQGELVRAHSLYEESLAIYRQLEDQKGIANVLNNLGSIAAKQGDLVQARKLKEECLALRRAVGDHEGISISLMNLGIVVRALGDTAAAQALYRESLTIMRTRDDRLRMTKLLNNMGKLAWTTGDIDQARAYHEESLKLGRELGEVHSVEIAIHSLGILARLHGDLAAARRLLTESLALNREMNNQHGIAHTLSELINLAAACAEFRMAARLAGIVQRWWAATGAHLSAADQEEVDAHLAQARITLGDDVFTQAVAEGQNLNLDDVQAWLQQANLPEV